MFHALLVLPAVAVFGTVAGTVLTVLFGLLGLAFIAEAAIPFAASDPVHVLPACIVGSGVAGAMSMLFNCTLMAPHGGIFVFPVMGNPLFYLLALVVGTAISTVLLGVLKKNVEE